MLVAQYGSYIQAVPTAHEILRENGGSSVQPKQEEDSAFHR